MNGREVARHRGASRAPTSVVQLAPRATSALVLWGCILQLASLDRTKRFTLRYGESGEPVPPVAYSPDGRHAFMGRYEPRLGGGPPVPPEDAVVLDAATLQGIYRPPVDANSAVWPPPAQ